MEAPPSPSISEISDIITATHTFQITLTLSVGHLEPLDISIETSAEIAARHTEFEPTDACILENNSLTLITPLTIQRHIAETLSDDATLSASISALSTPASYPAAAPPSKEDWVIATGPEPLTSSKRYPAKTEDRKPDFSFAEATAYERYPEKTDGTDLEFEDLLDEHYPFTYFPVTITSPVLPFTPTSLIQVSTLLKLLTETYYIRIAPDDHPLTVAIARPGNAAFDLLHLKRFVAFVWVFEPQFNTLFKKTPGSIRDIDTTHWIEAAPRIFRNKPKGAAVNSLEAAALLLTEVKTMKDLSDAVEELDDNLQRHVSLKKVFEADRMKRDVQKEQAIIFRQQPMSVDPAEVVIWLQTVAAIVEYTAGMTAERVLGDIVGIAKQEVQAEKDEEDFLENGLYSVMDVLRLLGADDAALDWFRERDVFHEHRVRT